MDGVGERESKRREKEADIFWFTRKANKAPDTGLVLFMEATGALSMEQRRRVPFFWSGDAERLFDWVLEARAKK